MATPSNPPPQIDPMTLLPPHMQEHIRPRHAGTKGWLAVSLVLLVVGIVRYASMDETPAHDSSYPNDYSPHAETSPPAVDHQAATATESTIKVKGLQRFKIKHKTKGVRFYWNEQTFKLELDGDKLELKIGGQGTQYHLKKKEGKWNLYHLGSRVYHVKTPDGGTSYSVYDNNSAKLFRVKTKSDSFNVYDGGGQRLFKGKKKYGNYIVRDKRDDSKVLTISGDLSMKEAAMLSFPVEPPYLALLYLVLQ